MQRQSLLVVLLALLASAARAETLTVSASASGSPGGTPIFDPPGVYMADLPQFDPALGELQSVEFTVHGYHRGNFTFTSVVGNWQVRVDYIDYSFEVNAFSGSGGNLLFLPWVTEPTPAEPFGGPPGHWNLPLTPVPQGTTLGPLPFGNDLTFEHTYMPGEPELAAFSGTGTLPVEIRDWAVFSVSTYGSGSNHWELASVCGIDVEATYTYSSPAAVGPLAVAEVPRLYPNPSHGQVQLAGIVAAPDVEWCVFDMSGRECGLFVGNSWSGDDLMGRRVPAGVYFVRPSKVSAGPGLKLIRR